MNRVLTIAVLTFAFTGLTCGQSHRDLITKIRAFNLLESTRRDISNILADYNTQAGNDYSERYYSEDVYITVHYSNGTCSEDSEDDDPSMTWSVTDWVVTGIEISFRDDMALKDIGFDLSKFAKEQMYRDLPEWQIYHDKARGLAIETSGATVDRVIFFPQQSSSSKLCASSSLRKAFYSRKSWYDKKLKDRFVCNWVNMRAIVNDVTLGAVQIEATTSKTVPVTTVASDPEHDILTYTYKVSAGRVIGNGAKVSWDLAGVQAGTYSITVGVDDGGGVGNVVTKTIVIR